MRVQSRFFYTKKLWVNVSPCSSPAHASALPTYVASRETGVCVSPPPPGGGPTGGGRTTEEEEQQFECDVFPYETNEGRRRRLVSPFLLDRRTGRKDALGETAKILFGFFDMVLLGHPVSGSGRRGVSQVKCFRRSRPAFPWMFFLK